MCYHQATTHKATVQLKECESICEILDSPNHKKEDGEVVSHLAKVQLPLWISLQVEFPHQKSS